MTYNIVLFAANLTELEKFLDLKIRSHRSSRITHPPPCPTMQSINPSAGVDVYRETTPDSLEDSGTTKASSSSLFIKLRSGSLPVSSSLPDHLVNLRNNESRIPAGGSLKQTSHYGSSPPHEADSLKRIVDVDLGALDITQGNLSDTDLNKTMERYRSMVPFLNGGLPLLKVSLKSRKRILLQVDPSEFKIVWKITAKASSSNGVSGFQKLLNNASVHNYKTHELSINCIKWMAVQSEASGYREELHISKEFESQWITIYYLDVKKDKLKTLHLITDTEHDFKRLTGLIDTLRKVREALTTSFLHEADDITELRKSLLSAPPSESQTKEVRELLYLDDILKYARRLNINLDESFLRDVFDSVSSKTPINGSRGLTFEGFKEFVSVLKRRDDVTFIWTSCFGATETIDFEEFANFLAKTQKENHNTEHAKKLFVRFSRREDRLLWNKECFNAFLLSKYSAIYKPISDENYHSRPLNDYFISSSHNTYLTGRQVVGDSSIDGYVRAFHRGCKCVEIDVWDGMSVEGAEVEDTELTKGPIVNHGRTFTSSISLKNVLQTVKKYAFVVSNSPVILSMEIHCNPESQLKIKRLLFDILGDALVTDMLDNDGLLPSPEKLKNKILLKIKRTGERTYSVSRDGQSVLSTSTTSTSFSEDGSAQSRTSFSLRRRTELRNILTELSDLAVYIQGIKFRNFSLPESKTFNHCISLSEKSFNTLLSDTVKKASLQKHNRKYLMRVYPSKMRIGSSNFAPVTFWNSGVQMVATNWQTYDIGQQINEAMFHGAGRCGYVLKPQNLQFQKKNRRQESVVAPRIKFTITIISALQLPKSKGSNAATNPFVSVEIHGSSSVAWDGSSQDPSTLIVSANGFNPMWNELFSCTMTTENDMQFLRIVVNSSLSSHEKDDPHALGIMVLRMSSLREGYRYLPINDPLGEELVYSKLLVYINKTSV